MPNVLLKLLVKDKPLYSRKVREKRETNLRGERNEVTADERQTDSWKLRERQQTRTNQHVKLAVENRGEITLQHAEKYQPTRMVGS